MNNITAYHAKYFAHCLTRQLPANELNKLAASLHNGQVDITPHQIEVTLFAFKSPLSNGAIHADEVGLGKTLEKKRSEKRMMLYQDQDEKKETLLSNIERMLTQKLTQERSIYN